MVFGSTVKGGEVCIGERKRWGVFLPHAGGQRRMEVTDGEEKAVARSRFRRTRGCVNGGAVKLGEATLGPGSLFFDGKSSLEWEKRWEWRRLLGLSKEEREARRGGARCFGVGEAFYRVREARRREDVERPLHIGEDGGANGH